MSSEKRFADLHVSTMQAMGDEALGYGGRRLPIGCWSMMCHAVTGCETLGQALSRYCRFYQLFEMAWFPVLEEDDTLARVQSLAAVDSNAGVSHSTPVVGQPSCQWPPYRRIPVTPEQLAAMARLQKLETPWLTAASANASDC